MVVIKGNLPDTSSPGNQNISLRQRRNIEKIITSASTVEKLNMLSKLALNWLWNHLKQWNLRNIRELTMPTNFKLEKLQFLFNALSSVTQVSMFNLILELKSTHCLLRRAHNFKHGEIHRSLENFSNSPISSTKYYSTSSFVRGPY